jgi:hypothetical protein
LVIVEAEMSKRKDREAQFLSSLTGATTSLSSDLTDCALSELILALDERRKHVYRMTDNHYASHSIGSILLLVAAFEAWLNEVIGTFNIINPDLKVLAFQPINIKFYNIPKKLVGNEIPPQRELNLVTEIRDEIAHYLPRVINERGNLPNWLYELQEKGLFITSSNTQVDFIFAHKLSSYRLAYWAWESMSSAIEVFMNSLGDKSELIDGTASNFSRYQIVCPPNMLPYYDVENKLELTR